MTTIESIALVAGVYFLATKIHEMRKGQCWWFSHQWSKWSEPNVTDRSYCPRQHRVCSKCNLHDERLV